MHACKRVRNYRLLFPTGELGLEYLDVQITGFPFVPNAKEFNANISFIPSK